MHPLSHSFGVDKCLGAGIKGGEQGFREEKALGIRVFNVMALDDIIFSITGCSREARFVIFDSVREGPGRKLYRRRFQLTHNRKLRSANRNTIHHTIACPALLLWCRAVENRSPCVRKKCSLAAFTRIRIARYPDIRAEGTRVSAKRLHVSRYPELLYDTHAQCGTNMICARVSKVTAVLQRGFFGDFLSFINIERTFLPCS